MSQCSTLSSYGVPAALVLVGSLIWFQDNGKKPKPAPEQGGDAGMMAMPVPGPEHEWLQKDVGTWDAAMKMWMDPKGQPMETKGTFTSRAFGGFWVEGEWKGDFMGQPFTGHDVSGYDSGKKKYIGMWHDTSGPFFMYSEGNYDAKSRTLTMKGEMSDPMHPSGTVKFTNKVVWKDDDHKTMTMHEDHGNGNDYDSMVIEYTRRKK
jgi:hypothetical protein